MPTDDIIARADANYFATWRSIVAAADGGELVEGDGVLITNTAMPIAFFNVGFVTRRLNDPEGAIKRIVSYFDERRLPFIIRVREGVDLAAEAAAKALGVPYSDTVPGMVLDAIPPRGAPLPGLEVRAATDESGLQHHVEVIAEGFGMPLAFARQFLSSNMMRTPDVTLYVGYADGAPVASSALIATNRVAGVYNVACLPSHRKRGFGEALTWHAVHEGAAIGCTFASLQASEMGAPIYQRMGFRVVAPYRTFVRPEHRH